MSELEKFEVDLERELIRAFERRCLLDAEWGLATRRQRMVMWVTRRYPGSRLGRKEISIWPHSQAWPGHHRADAADM